MSRPLGCLALLAVLLPPLAQAADDALPEGALARIGRPGLRHEDQALGVASAPDGKTFASAGDDRVIRLWDTATGNELRTFTGHTDGINAIAISSDGKTLVSASEDGSARVWDVATGKERLAFRGHGVAVKSVVIDRDGKVVATKGDDAAVRLWDAANGKEITLFASEKGHGRSDIAFSPDGKAVAAVGANGGLALWDAKTGKKTQPLPEPETAEYMSLAFSPDGKRLVGGALDGTIRLWDVEKGKHLRDLGKRADLVASVRISPDGKLLAAGCGDGTIHFWDAEGKELRTLKGHTDTTESLAFSPDSKILVSASHDRTVRIWDAAAGTELSQSASGGVSCAVLSADGKLLASGHRDGSIRFWDPTTGKARPLVIAAKLPIIELCPAPDGKTIASRRGGVEDIVLWETATGKELAVVHEHGPAGAGARINRGLSGTIAFSPDGKLLASVDAKQEVRLWEAKSGKELPGSPLKDPNEPSALHVVFAADGGLFVGYASSHVLYWNVTAGRVGRRIILPSGEPTGIALSPDGRSVATAAGRGGVHLWELATGEERTPEGRFPDRAAGAVAFTANGRLLIAGCSDGVVRISDTYSRKEVDSLRGHRSAVTSLTLGGGKLLTVDADGAALVWDVARLKLTRPEAEKLTVAQLAALWDDLAGEKAADGYQAIGRAVAAGTQAVAPLRERLEQLAGVDSKRIAALIADLDADDFETREKATKELGTIGVKAVPALRKALDGSPSAEVRQRAEGLLKKLDGPMAVGQQQRLSRALEALEAIGSPEAVKALEVLAKRQDELGQEAKAALERLQKRGAP
jgi:WD40 repeat protein